MDDLEKLLLNKGIASMLPKKEEEDKSKRKFKNFLFRFLNYEIVLFISVTKRG